MSDLSAFTGAFFALPAIAYFVMWVFVPTGYGFWLSLTNSSFFSTGHFIGLGNFTTLFHSSMWWNSVIVTALYVAEVVPASLVLAFIAAYLIRGLKRVGGFFTTLFFLPFVIPSVASAIIFELIFTPGGILNDVLHLRIAWLTDPRTVLLAVSMVTSWTLFGFYVVIFLSGFQAVPISVSEAARVDGAGALRRLWSIELPLMRPMILFSLVTAIAFTLTNFTVDWVMTQGGPGNETDILPVSIYQQAFIYSQPAEAEAMAVLLFGTSLLLTLIQFAVLGRDQRK